MPASRMPEISPPNRQRSGFRSGFAAATATYDAAASQTYQPEPRVANWPRSQAQPDTSAANHRSTAECRSGDPDPAVDCAHPRGLPGAGPGSGRVPRVCSTSWRRRSRANGLQGAQTLVNITQRAREFGLDIKRDDLRFIYDVVSESDPWFEQGTSAGLFASRFRNFVVARCRSQGLSLSADELDLIEAWFSAPQQQQQQPARQQAYGGRPAPAAPQQASRRRCRPRLRGRASSGGASKRGDSTLSSSAKPSSERQMPTRSPRARVRMSFRASSDRDFAADTRFA